jgi:hypothetical protein
MASRRRNKKVNKHRVQNKIWIMVMAAVSILSISLLFSFGGAGIVSFGQITGSATLQCQHSFDGITCSDNTDYNMADLGCENNQVIVCTNECEIQRAKIGGDELCATYCENYCMSEADAQKLKSVQVSLV